MRATTTAALSSFWLLACAGGSASSAPAEPAGAGGEGPRTIGFDLKEHLLASATGAASEAPPAGVPSHWDWVAAATTTRTTPPGPQYSHSNYWGALFRGLSDVTPPNTLVQLRACSMWFLREGSTDWTEADASPKLDGSTFSPAYAAGGPAPSILVQLPTGLDVVPAEGHIYHFWQDNGYQPTPQTVREIVVNCQARLAMHDPSAADDRAQADYLVHVGADFRDPTDPSCQNDQNICPSWGVGRLERVTNDWRNHTFHSLTPQDLSSGVPLPRASFFAFDD